MRILILIVAFLGCALSGDALAQAYQRKTAQPSYFMPSNVLAPKKEVLPEIVLKKAVYEEPVAEATETGTEDETETEIDEELSFPEPNHTQYTTVPAKDQVEDRYYPENEPTYQYKYDEYISDLRIIGEKGSAPVNKKLQDDLDKMSSNNHFVVEDDFGVKPVAQNVKVKSVKRY